MKLLVIGASRGIGAQVVSQALSAGHQLTAMARHTEGMSATACLRLVQADVRDGTAVLAAMDGQDAVVMTVACRPSLRPVSLFSEGTRQVLRAMQAHGVRQLVCVTGIGAGDSYHHGGFVYDRLVLPLLLRTMYADKNRQEALLRAADCDWVIVRPGFLTNGPLTCRYAVYTDLTGVQAGRISRADVAHFILTQLETMRYRHMTPLITGCKG